MALACQAESGFAVALACQAGGCKSWIHTNGWCIKNWNSKYETLNFAILEYTLDMELDRSIYTSMLFNWVLKLLFDWILKSFYT